MAVLLNNTRWLFVGNALDVGCFCNIAPHEVPLRTLGWNPELHRALIVVDISDAMAQVAGE